MDNISFIHVIWVAVCAGIIGTAGMEFALQGITKSGIVNADMTRALGSLFTKSRKYSYRIGIILQAISGIIFAFIYIFAFLLINPHDFINFIGVGILMGFIQGAVVGFVLVAAVAENHPLPEFRQAGFSVALAHWAGHLVYGFLVSAVFYLIVF